MSNCFQFFASFLATYVFLAAGNSAIDATVSYLQQQERPRFAQLQ
jgi:hypothetical protein